MLTINIIHIETTRDNKMKIQTITLKNNIGRELQLDRTVTETKQGLVYGRLWDSGLCGLNDKCRRELQSLGMRCKYDNGTGFSVGKVVDLPEYKEVPNIYKTDTSDLKDINVYTVVSIETIALEDLK